ncbi:MAG TPA: hypothetical protein VFV38_09810 [Ktedonobacteraceae bacterium]|nr:hypothetical protein [Ktedonobacteraceae bacterium]
MSEHGPQPEEIDPDAEFSMQADVSLSSFPLVEIDAFPSSLKARPWSRNVEIVLGAGEVASCVRVTWPHVQIDLGELGQIEMMPLFLTLSFPAIGQTPGCSFLLCDHNQREIARLSPGSSSEQSASRFSEKTCLLKIVKTVGSLAEKLSFTVSMQLHTFRAILSRASEKLRWREENEGRRTGEGSTVEYQDPSLLLAELGIHVARLLEETQAIEPPEMSRYRARRRELATILFALGRAAHAIEAYPQAVQFYGKSQQIFRSPGDKEMKEKILLILRDLFLRQGKKEQAKHVALQLLNLRASYS